MEMVKSDVVTPDVAKIEEPILEGNAEQAKKEIVQEVEESRLVDLAAFQFNLIEDQITRADTKAGLVVAADSVFATASLLTSSGMMVTIFNSQAHPIERIAGVLMILVLGSIFFSTLNALLAARPSLKIKDNDEGTLFFFGTISKTPHEEFIDRFSSQSLVNLRRAILTEVHNTAQIAQRKFRRVTYSLDLLIVAVILWAIVLALRAFVP